MMNRLQSLFNRLAGVPDDTGLSQAGNSPSHHSQAFTALEKPACWRRQVRQLDLSRARHSR